MMMVCWTAQFSIEEKKIESSKRAKKWILPMEAAQYRPIVWFSDRFFSRSIEKKRRNVWVCDHIRCQTHCTASWARFFFFIDSVWKLQDWNEKKGKKDRGDWIERTDRPFVGVYQICDILLNLNSCSIFIWIRHIDSQIRAHLNCVWISSVETV